MRDDEVLWGPFVPLNAQDWDERIHALAEKANQRRQSGRFLMLSRTSQTRTVWSLPAIAACPVRDETCAHCYALGRRFRWNHANQIDRALRLEYLQRLVRENQLRTWVDWMTSQLNRLRPDEPFPSPAPAPFAHGGPVRYLRWHDSGDLFHEQYARAIFRVCEATPKVAHWLPTRMGRLIKSLVQRGVTVPPNLSILVSVQRGGALESAQVEAVQAVLNAQPSARIGLSYFVVGPRSRQVDRHLVQRQFGAGAVACPAITAKDKADRVCAGCRRCWAASVDSPIIYPKI
jgi:protein gp37